MICYDMTNAEYHADRLHVSKSWLWKLKWDGPRWTHALWTGEQEDKRSDAMLIGSALDALLTEGDGAFEEAYAVKPDGIDLRTERGKKWASDNAGKEFLHWEQGQVIRDMAAAFRSEPQVMALVATALAQASVFGVVDGVLARARPDWLHLGDELDGAYTVDLKTTGNLRDFQRTAWDLGYFHQYALANRLLAAEGKVIEKNYLVVVEKRRHSRLKLVTLAEEGLAQADAEILDLLHEWDGRMREGRWHEPMARAEVLLPPRWTNG